MRRRCVKASDSRIALEDSGEQGRISRNAMSSDQTANQKPPTSPPPPPVPRRPSFKVLNKLKHALSVDGAETEQSTNTTTFDTKSETPIPTDKDNDNIFNSVAKASREIYYGNHTLLFASTETGGFFLSSDDDGCDTHTYPRQFVLLLPKSVSTLW